VFLCITIASPLLDIEIQGQDNSISLVGTATALIDSGYYLLGVMIFTFVVAAPTLMLAAMMSLFAGLLLRIESRAWFWITRCFYLMKDWNMKTYDILLAEAQNDINKDLRLYRHEAKSIEPPASISRLRAHDFSCAA
jgi:uncharacterized paraquat-inducible protein A